MVAEFDNNSQILANIVMSPVDFILRKNYPCFLINWSAPIPSLDVQHTLSMRCHINEFVSYNLNVILYPYAEHIELYFPIFGIEEGVVVASDLCEP